MTGAYIGLAFSAGFAFGAWCVWTDWRREKRVAAKTSSLRNASVE